MPLQGPSRTSLAVSNTQSTNTLISLLLPSSGGPIVQGNQIQQIAIQFIYIRLQPPMPFFSSDRQNFTHKYSKECVDSTEYGSETRRIVK